VGDIRRRHDQTPAPGDRPRRSALDLLPDDWRDPVRFFYLAYSDTLKGAAGTVTMIRFWIKEVGLTLDECRAIMRDLLRPEVVATIQFPGQLIARMAGLVAEAVKERKAEQERRERRDQAEQWQREKAQPDVMRAIIEQNRIGLES